MDEKELIKILEGFNKKLDIIIEAQTRTIEELQESRETGPSLRQRMAEWKSNYVSQY